MNKYDELWQKILYELEQIYNEELYTEVFEPLKSINCIKNGLVYIVVPSAFIKGRINQLYANRINDIALKFNPSEPVRFKFITESEIPLDDDITKKEKNIENRYRINANLNAFYSFDNFVVGDSNYFAFRMANLVADQLGAVANPLYIYGDVGLGKTHLMQAIGNYIIEKDMSTKVLYVKAGSFIEDFSNLLKSDKMNDFHEKYREVDCLLIDDIQILSGASKTQMEFFKLYDILFQNNKQIVITSDQPAANLKNITSRLTSRFQQGLAVDIGVPNLVHRITILKKKLESDYPSDLVLTDDVLEFIAENFPTNIRELDGALKRVVYYCLTSNLTPTIEISKEALESLLLTRRKSSNISENNYDKIQSVVSDYFQITVADLIGKNRKAEYVKARHISMYLIKLNYDIPYKTIGTLFGGRDHSTVLSGCTNIEHGLKNDETLKQAVETISKKINSPHK